MSGRAGLLVALMAVVLASCEVRGPGASGSLAADMRGPTIAGAEFDAAAGAVRGEIAGETTAPLVELYDGPALLASSDESRAGAGVAHVAIEPGPGSLRFTAAVALPPGEHVLTVVALDAHGNESRLDVVASVPH